MNFLTKHITNNLNFFLDMNRIESNKQVISKEFEIQIEEKEN